MLAQSKLFLYNSYKLNNKSSLKMQTLKTQKTANKNTKALAFVAVTRYNVCKLVALVANLNVTLTVIAALQKATKRNVAQN
jgi:hypothetical protein